MTLLVRSEVDACEGAGGRASAPVSAPKPSSAAAAADGIAETSAESGEDLLAMKLEGVRLSSSGEGKSKVGRRAQFDTKYIFTCVHSFTFGVLAENLSPRNSLPLEIHSASKFSPPRNSFGRNSFRFELASTTG